MAGREILHRVLSVRLFHYCRNVPGDVITQERNADLSGCVLGKSDKIRKHGRDEIAVMRVGRCKAGHVEIEYILRLGHRLRPRGGRRGENLEFDDALLVAQQLRVDLDIGQQRRISVAFCAAMPRCPSSSIGVSVMLPARVDALRIRQVDRAD